MLLQIVIFIVFFGVLIFFYWLFEVLFVKERFVERLSDLDPMRRVIEDKKIQQKQRKSPLAGLSKLVPKREGSKMASKLIRANLTLTAEEVLIYKLLFGSVLGFTAYTVKQDYFVVALMVFGVWNIPNIFINRRIKNRLDDFNDQLNSGLVLISNALKAGHSFMQAVSIAARETQGTFSEEFKILLKELNFGIPIEIGFSNLLERVNSADMKLVVNAILIQMDIGGNLSEILENISGTIRDRQKIKNEMNTLTAQGKMSGFIVMLLPVFLGSTIYLFNREYIMLLFQTKIGLILLGMCVFNEFVGFMIIRKIITIDL
ncbi:MAG: type II secretion system F family protein [Clostridia bacterium]|nr:type II secretion system F family protein [Clostridia bacterium]